MFDRHQFDLDAPRVLFYHNTKQIHETDPARLYERVVSWCALHEWPAAATEKVLHMCTQTGLAPFYRQKFDELQRTSCVANSSSSSSSSSSSGNSSRSTNTQPIATPGTHLIDAGPQRVMLEDGGLLTGNGDRVVVLKPFVVVDDKRLSPCREIAPQDGGVVHPKPLERPPDDELTTLMIVLNGRSSAPQVHWTSNFPALHHKRWVHQSPLQQHQDHREEEHEDAGCFGTGTFRVCGVPVASAVLPVVVGVLVCVGVLVNES
jgi:hypothetical protein